MYQIPFQTEVSHTDLIRMLMNITMPKDLSDDYYQNQDHYLQELLGTKTIVKDFSFNDNDIAIFQGDITFLQVDAIVNACNEKLLGCFQPLHNCIDNAIHSYAGLQVRRDLMKIMADQGFDEPNGQCKVTSAYNLPSNYIFHTVGPKINVTLSLQDIADLASCYRTCIDAAAARDLKTIAFPCISTGLYGFPPKKAAQIAYATVLQWKKQTQSPLRVIFNVFQDSDLTIYREILGETHEKPII